jgi:DNA-binding response OmpR family regulator
VLIVDDDESITEFVCWVLGDEGHDVVSAPNGAAALKLVEELRPDLILLDMRMPVMDGWQFAKAYRASGRDGVPIVVLTAARDAAQSARDIGADGYLGKPFNLDDLVATVKRFQPVE